MVFRILSDLHLEFQREKALEWLSRFDFRDGLPLLVAGDLCTAEQLRPALRALCALNVGTVAYVPGNHEYYGSSIGEVGALLGELQDEIENLEVLQNRAVEIQGRRILGGTLWFPARPEARRYERGLADFRQIEEFKETVYEEHRKTREFLERELRAGDIVVTHHLPSVRSVSDRFIGSPYNAFFVSPLDGLILERRPAAWVHGHTHDSKDYMLGATRVLCNPFGYFDSEENAGFVKDKLAEV